MAVIYKNGTIITMAGNPTAEALIEKDGQIVLVGSLKQAEAWQKEHSEEKMEERDLAGHTLLGFPAGTFTVNAAGSLVIGFLLALAPSASASQLLVVGFCGGFTTFSTFSADAVRLLRAGDYGPAAAYVALSVAVCIAFAALGMWIGAQLKN